MAYTEPTSGLYYLRITNATGTFYLLSLTSGGSFDTESNNTTGTAQPIGNAPLSPGSGLQVTGGLTAGDSDWYSYTVSTAGDINDGIVEIPGSTTPSAGYQLLIPGNYNVPRPHRRPRRRVHRLQPDHCESSETRLRNGR